MESEGSKYSAVGEVRGQRLWGAVSKEIPRMTQIYT